MSLPVGTTPNTSSSNAKSSSSSSKPSKSREKSSTSGARPSNPDKKFIICFDLPLEASQSRRWEDIKDYAKAALQPSGHRPGFTAAGPRGDRLLGYVLLRSHEDGLAVYDALMRYPTFRSQIYVHLYDQSFDPPELVQCTCPTGSHQIHQDHFAHHSEPFASTAPSRPDPVQQLAVGVSGLQVNAASMPQAWGYGAGYSVPAGYAAQPTVRTAAQTSPYAQQQQWAVPNRSIPQQYSSQQQFAPQSQYTPQQQYAPHQQYAADYAAAYGSQPAASYPTGYGEAPYQQAAEPAMQVYQGNYVQNSDGLSVNVSDGLVQAELNMVILKNLDRNITEKQLRKALSLGEREATIRVNPVKDLSKKTTSAKVTFWTYQEAQALVDRVTNEGTKIKEREVKASIAKEGTIKQGSAPGLNASLHRTRERGAPQPSGPAVVNGSA